MKLTAAAAIAVLALNGSADAHDAWTTGVEPPAWVKAECCGKADSHHLRFSAVHVSADGYHIDGLKTVVPIERALPSQDGQVWAFWNPLGEPTPVIFCFFYPLDGS